MTQALIPDSSTMEEHLTWLLSSALATHPDLMVEIAWGHPDKGPNCAKTFSIGDIAEAARFAEWINKKGNNVYVGVTLKCADAPAKGRTASEHAALATCMAIDIDKNFCTDARKLGAIVKPQLIVSTGTVPEQRAQLWIAITPIEDMQLWDELNRRSVAYCGGDQNALGTYRLMRLAGSVSFTSRKKAARGYIPELTTLHTVAKAVKHDVNDLLPLFPPFTATPAGTQADFTKRAKVAGSAAGDISPAARPPVNRINIALVCAMLNALPDDYAIDYGSWLRVGFALYDFDDGEIGLKLWKKFSERCPEKAAETDFEAEWAGLNREYEGDKIGIGSLWFWAQQHGWQPSRAWDRSTTAHGGSST